MRFASVRGAKHRYYRQPRQDAARAAVHRHRQHRLRGRRRRFQCVQFEQGAVAACQAALDRLLHLLDQPGEPIDLRDVACHAADRLRELTRWRLGGRDPEFSEVAGLYATTLVAGVVRPQPVGPWSSCAASGTREHGPWTARADSSCPVPHQDGVGRPPGVQHGDPLPHVPDPLEQTSRRLSSHEALLIGTDGFADPLGDGDGQVGSSSPATSRTRRRPCGSRTCWTSPGRPSTTTEPC